MLQKRGRMNIGLSKRGGDFMESSVNEGTIS